MSGVHGGRGRILALGVVLVALTGPADAAPQRTGEHGPAPASRVTTDHLQISMSVTEAVVTPGVPFSLVFDVRPRDRMHVYAPGAKSYKIINVALEADSVLGIKPLQYPSSETYFFEPLKERVPVFQRPFRLVQPITVSAAPEHRARLASLETFTIRGTLDYQACDDRICFAPKSVPVSFPLRLRQVGR